MRVTMHALASATTAAPGAARRDHARGSAARHPRGLIHGRLRIHRARRRRPRTQGHPRGRHPAPGAPAAARAAAAAGRGRRRSAQQEAQAPALLQPAAAGLRRRTWRSSPASWRPWCAPACRWRNRCWPSRSRPRSRACRASSLGVRARVMEGHTLAAGFAAFPAGVPGDLPRHGGRRRAGRAPGRRAGAARRLRREPRADPPEGAGAPCSTRSCSPSCASRSSRACWCTWCRRSWRIRDQQGQAAAHDPRADRHQRFPALLRHLPADRRHPRPGSSWGAGCATPPHAAASTACSCACR